MAASAKWYGRGLLGLLSAVAARRVDWDGDTIKVALCTASYSPDQDAHDFFDDLTNEVVGTGYIAGGQALVTAAPVYDAASNTLRLDADDASWPDASFSCRYAIIYKDTGNPATSPLLGFVDFGGTETISFGTFTIQWDATDGALRLVAA